MMNATNTYFLDLKRIGHEYEAARIERRARKQQIIDTLAGRAKSSRPGTKRTPQPSFPLSREPARPTAPGPPA